jgi:hypothetical protein
MDYITAKEAAEKWGIPSAEFSFYVSKETVAGAVV